jgi:heme exporter protein A
MIKVTGLVKNYGLNPVLRGVRFQVEAGEFVTLVGANGAGKSTLIRILATLAKPSSGEVQVGGWRLPQQANRVRRHIGLVSHQSLVYGDMTARENLAFFAKIYGLAVSEALLADSLKLVGLHRRADEPVRTFSRGMAQRLAIARATIHQPDILLLDEPYTGLDQDASHTLTQLLTDQHQSGKTIFMITHDLARGLDLCDRVLILNRGKIEQEIDRKQTTLPELMVQYQEVVRGKK